MNDFIVEIEKLVYGGEGLAHLPDGRAIFLPFVLPGETIRAKVRQDKGRYVRAFPVEVLHPSPLRTPAKCEHFGSCGGCHYQHMDYASQLSIKLEILHDQLERIGGFAAPPISGITPSPQSWYYRNQVQFHPSASGKLGFKDIGGEQTLEINQCHLPTPGLCDLWKQIELDPETTLNRISLREDSFGEQMLVFEGTEQGGLDMEVELPVSATYLNPDGSTLNLAGDDALNFTVLGKALQVSPESFFQVNLPVAEKMVEYLLSNLPIEKDLSILELYSGVGLFSVFLAEHVRDLTAIESAPSACYDFAANLDAFENVSLYEGAVEQLLPALVSELPTPDLVVLDPPRSGLHPKARDAVLQLAGENIIYISCDPSTLARDLKTLCAGGYQLQDIQAFDMFPQTYHVETMIELRRTQRVTS